MIEIENRLYQPVTLTLAGAHGSLHLQARETRHLPDTQVSPEIRMAAKRGVLKLTSIAKPEQPLKPRKPAKRRRKVKP